MDDLPVFNVNGEVIGKLKLKSDFQEALLSDSLILDCVYNKTTENFMGYTLQPIPVSRNLNDWR